MTCDELRDEYGAYALGVATDPELSEIATHLAQACPVCTEGVRSAMAIVTVMSGAVKTTDPPKRLRAKVVEMVRREPKRSWAAFVPWAVAGVLAVVLASVVLPPRLHPPVSEQKFEEALSILNDPVAKDVAFGEPTARGRVFVSPQKGVVVMAAHLPPITANQTFELWVIDGQGQKIPSGTFRSDADSTAVYVRPGPVSNAAAVAVTVEPAGGSPQPTTTPFIVTKL